MSGPVLDPRRGDDVEKLAREMCRKGAGRG